jgi:hypothetical protein
MLKTVVIKLIQQNAHDQIWLKYHLFNHATWFIMKKYEKKIVQYCTKDLNQGKDNTTLIYGDGYTKNLSL